MRKYFILVLIILLSFLFTMFLLREETYDYVVFIESISDNYLKSGTGIVYKKSQEKYYILTPYHIVDSSEKIYITNKKNQKVSASLLYYDDYTDIAILSVEKISLKVLEKKACSSSFGHVTIIGFNGGKVFKKSGRILDLNTLIDAPNIYGNSHYNAIKIESNIDYGDSGSIVLDDRKRAIGIVSLKDTNSNEAYAIPICDAFDTANLLESGKINRPNLMATIKNSLTISGVEVSNINKQSILNKMGLTENDIITRINGVRINNISEFRNNLFKLKAKDNVTLEYYRNGNYYNTTGIID